MKLLGWFVVGLLVGLFATATHAETKQEKDRRECRKATPAMKHPGDLEKAKREAFIRCMAARAPAAKKAR